MICSMYFVYRITLEEFVRQCNTKTLTFYFTFWRKSVTVVQHNKAANDLFHLHLKQRAFCTWRLFIYQQTLRHASKLFMIERKRNLLQSKLYFDTIFFLMNTMKHFILLYFIGVIIVVQLYQNFNV